jgi:hypothetical protein
MKVLKNIVYIINTSNIKGSWQLGCYFHDSEYGCKWTRQMYFSFSSTQTCREQYHFNIAIRHFTVINGSWRTENLYPTRIAEPMPFALEQCSFLLVIFTNIKEANYLEVVMFYIYAILLCGAEHIDNGICKIISRILCWYLLTS